MGKHTKNCSPVHCSQVTVLERRHSTKYPFPPMERFIHRHTPQFPFAMDDVNALHFSPDGQVLAIGTDNGLVLFYHHQTRRLIYKLIGDVPVTALMWHPTEQYALFVGGGDGSCNLHRFSDTRFVSFLSLPRALLSLQWHRSAPPVSVWC